MPRHPRDPPRCEAGFTLVEAVVAVAVVGIALLLDLGLQAQAREIERRLAVEGDLLARAEAALESVRAGVHPLRTGPVEPDLAWPSAASPDVTMILVVDPTEVAGLCRVAIHGQARPPRGGPRQVGLDSLVFQPGATCH